MGETPGGAPKHFCDPVYSTSIPGNKQTYCYLVFALNIAATVYENEGLKKTWSAVKNRKQNVCEIELHNSDRFDVTYTM